MKRHIIATAALAAILATGCMTKRGGITADTARETFAMTNRAGVVISGGSQASAMFAADGALGEWVEVAKAAAENGSEFSIIGIGHGANKQPDVKRESSSMKKAQDAFASGIAAAATGDKAGAAKNLGEAAILGAAYAAEMANPPAADDQSLSGFHAAVGPGANLSGVAVANEMGETRVAAIKAARASYQTVTRYEAEDVTTKDGLDTLAKLAPIYAEIAKAKQSPAPVAPPASSDKGDDPAVAVPPSSGNGGAGDLSTPAARVAAMYPGLRLGGGNEGAASERSLWKPVSDSNGKLAVVLPHSAMGKIISMTIDGETVRPDSIGNGWRPHLRFSKPGSAYSGAFRIETSEGAWTGTAPGGKRTEPIPMQKASGPLKVSDMTPEPAETPKAGEAAAPGER